MTAPNFLPSNALVAAFPQTPRRQICIRRQEGRERWAARKAEIEASRPVSFQPRIEFIPPTRAGLILGEKPVHRLTGRSGERHTFVRVSSVDRAALVAGPVVLVAIRRMPGRVDTLGAEAFEPENAARLNAWISRATAARDVELLACSTIGSRIERATVAADLTDKPVRATAFVSAGRFDLRAIMAAAIATAKTIRKATGLAWGVCLSAALRDAWQAAKAARLAAAH
ncbi:hypothetical protein [Methylobacterium thuringiense]|uniref:Uncharacterized protein n=1 Tax=Methylobacterium thuringiense TaxID=1003091 RepID=A0ABQ4TPP0_9HYPH|nr:hypothetical protein [Methylobacterium thuringiense]GJE57328.1 hypothetical protein EKPJFOCH_3842 [Methylobacterium thuringiense]